MLNPQEIAAARKQLNITPQAPAAVDRSADFAAAMGTSTDAPAADPVTPEAPAPTFASVGSKIGSDFNTRADNVGKIEESTDNPASKLLQIGGEGAGAVNDTIGDVVTSAIKPEVLQAIGTHLAPLVQSAAQSPAGKAVLDWFSGLPPETQRNLGATGNIASLLSNAIGAGAAKEGIVAGTDAALSAAKDTIAPMADAAQGAVDTAKQTVKDAVLGTPEANAAAEAAIKSKTTAAVTDKITQQAETMTPTMKKAALDEGRQMTVNNKLGGTDVSYKPTQEVQRAGEILSDPKEVTSPIKPTDTGQQVYNKVKSAISQKGAAAEKFLADNPVEVSAKDENNMLTEMRTGMAENSTRSEMNAYNEQIELFQNKLEKQFTKTGTLNTSDYYSALKDYEANIASKTGGGKASLIDPEGISSAKIQAAADLRQHVRDLIGEKHPEFKSQMYDLMSLYEAKDNALFNASKIKSQTIFDKYPKTTKAVKTGASVFVGDKALKAVSGIGI